MQALSLACCEHVRTWPAGCLLVRAQLLLLCLTSCRVWIAPAVARRYAGCSYETAAAVAAGQGKLLVKGVRAVWRQSAPLLQHMLMVRPLTCVASARSPGCSLGCVASRHVHVLRALATARDCCCQGALERMLMQRNIPAAVSFVEGEITRLLSGR